MSISIEIINTVNRKYLQKKSLKGALIKAAEGERIKKAEVSVIIADKEYIRRLNVEYLSHDWDTDVIAFSLEDDFVGGEIYISMDAACQQSKEYGVSLTNELKRLAVHGFLHLAGYDDATEEQRCIMNKLENKYIG
jgi:rRNA maturation RNase YbeY